MHNLWTIARFSFLEAVRARFFVVVFVFSLVALAVGAFLASIPWGDVDQVMLSIGWGAINLFSILLAVFFATQQIAHDRERRSLYMILARPVSRFTYLCGRAMALLALLAISIALMTAALAAALVLFGGASHNLSDFWLPAVWVWGKAASLTCYAVAISTLLSQFPALFVTFAVYVIGSSSGTLLAFAQQEGEPIMLVLVKCIYWLFPDYGIFDLIPRIVHGMGYPSPVLLLRAVGYFLGYGILVLGCAAALFERRDLD